MDTVTGSRVDMQTGDDLDSRILRALHVHRIRLRLRVLSSAQAIAWADLPPNEREAYIDRAAAALAGMERPS